MSTAIECFCKIGDTAITLTPLTPEQLQNWLRQAPSSQATWVRANGFEARAGQHCPLPDARGAITQVLVAVAGEDDPDVLGALPNQLAPGSYVLDCDWSEARQLSAVTGFALGAYRYGRYRKKPAPQAKIQPPAGCDETQLRARVEAIYLARDLINTPMEDLPPEALATAAVDLARRQGADCAQIIGDDLLRENYPAIHAVGRASAHPPQLIDLRWGDAAAPRLTLVGKGVCFDSGGLDLKPAAGMRLMKKDMGGAAHDL